jgi:PBP1b-binding outer membrane lipoprotein LpoB
MQKMKRIIQILTFTLLIFGLNSCALQNERQDYADMLIEKVEPFKRSNNRLPKDVSELGLIEKMDSPAFYQIKTDSTYIVWYGLSVGESKIYRSETRIWSEEG